MTSEVNWVLAIAWCAYLWTGWALAQYRFVPKKDVWYRALLAVVMGLIWPISLPIDAVCKHYINKGEPQ